MTIHTWSDHRATALDVRWDWAAMLWRVRGEEGDYGLVETQPEAVRIAISAAVTGGHAIGQTFRRIHVYDRDGTKRLTITSVKGRLRRPALQFFQDDVE